MLVRQQRDGEETALPGKQHVPGPDVSTRSAGLLGIGAAARRGHGPPPQKQNCPFGGPQISQNQAETWYICLSKGTPQRDMPLGDRPWQSTDHRWLQDVWSEQGGHIYAEVSPLCMSLMQRCCFMSHPWVKSIPEAPVQVLAQAEHPGGGCPQHRGVRTSHPSPQKQVEILAHPHPVHLHAVPVPSPGSAPWLDAGMKIKCKYYCWQRLPAPPL